MELSPRLYHWLVRPKWFTKLYISNTIQSHFNFDNKTVLDFGCGIGTNCYLFNTASYIGVDCDQKRINYAKRLYSDYKFYTLKENHIPIDTDSVDYIVIISVLHHISSEELSNYLQEFRRILRPNGKIIIMEPCFFEHAHLCNYFMAFFDRGKYIRNEEEYLNLFNKCHYQTNKLKKFNQLFFYNKLIFSAVPIS